MKLAEFPRTVLEFEARFPDEAACREYLYSVKWPDGFVCDRCGGRKAYFVIERGLEQCAACRRQKSVTANTLFHGCRAGLRRWFRAILEFVSRKSGCNAQDIRRLVGVSEPIAWQWLHKFREAIRRRDHAPLTGDVEIDEAYVGGPEPGVQGRDLGENKQLLAVGVEVIGRACGRTRLEPAPSAKAEDLQPFVLENVAEGSTLHTDDHGGYRHLDKAYKHRVQVIRNPKTASKKFPHVHRVISLVRRFLLGTYHGSWSKKYAAAYCEEFEFRFNRRNSLRRPSLLAAVIKFGMSAAPSLFRKSRATAVIPAAT